MSLNSPGIDSSLLHKTCVVDRLTKLRECMKAHGIDAYLVPSADQHNNEYVPEWWKRRAYISGFNGSAGDVVVTAHDGGLWTDGRYFLQASEQLSGTGLELYKVGEPETVKIEDWIANQCGEGGCLGADPKTISIETATKLEKALSLKGGHLQLIDRNLVDEIWGDQPEITYSPLETVPNSIAGKSIAEKLNLVRRKMAEKNCSVHMISALDSIAWLFNLRGSDIDYNRIFVAYAAVTGEKAYLFIHSDRVTDEIHQHLGELVECRAYGEEVEFLKQLESNDTRLWLDAKETSKWLEIQVSGNMTVYKERAPISDLKAVKNQVELQGFKDCHLTDGVAMVRFLKWLDEAVPKGGITECSASKQLQKFRSEQEGFIGCSFPTIAGYQAHGAIIHYEANQETDAELRQEGIFLLDSGAHYTTGTTDITRTIALGDPTQEHKQVFTRVLKGLIDLSSLVFPKGFSGKQIELPARRALWDSGRNFNHGTGHGVGHSLNVHEGPVYLSPKAPEVALEAGNVLSNEPGFYKPGQFGMRIENLMIVRKDEKLSSSESGDFLSFETITFCPIDLKLVEVDLLLDTERVWLNEYHRQVFELLSPNLDPPDKDWLKKTTRPV